MKRTSGTLCLRLLALVLAFAFTPGLYAAEDPGHPGELSSSAKEGVITIEPEAFEKAGMAVAKVMTADNKIIAPVSAVVWHDGKAWVYVQADNTHYRRTLVEIENVLSNDAYEAGGLPADASVVTRGAQLMLSEEFGGHEPIEDED